MTNGRAGVVMPECGYLHVCKFMSQTMADKVALADLLRQKYCFSASPDCARLKAVRALGAPEYVPLDLWPNDMLGADRLIAQSTS